MAKKPTVIGIIGKTHGVRFSASPPTKRMSSVSGSPCSAYAAERRSFATGATPFGAAERGVKLGEVAGAAGVAAGVTAFASIVTSTSRGGRQTVSLQAW